jgi:hypothetical protein
MRALVTIIVIGVLGWFAFQLLSRDPSYMAQIDQPATQSLAGKPPSTPTASPPASGLLVTKPHGTVSTDARQQIADLRDEAIDTIGWIAGNARGHTTWSQVQAYVGKGGPYYKFLISLKGPVGSNDEAEALGNLQRYDRAVETGANASFSTSEEVDRTKRAVAISKQIGALLKS